MTNRAGFGRPEIRHPGALQKAGFHSQSDPLQTLLAKEPEPRGLNASDYK